MDFDEYQQKAKRTAKELDFEGDLTHTALGMCGEAGEFADAVKKHVIYGQPLNVTNLDEEIGDMLWFCALAASTISISLSEIAEKNIKKLKARYPEKYTDFHAAARLDKE